MFRQNKITFREWDYNTRFFELLKEGLETENNNVAGLIDFEQLRSVFNFNYSDMIINRKVKYNDVDIVVSNIIFKYGKKWEITHNLMYNKIRDGVSSYRTTTNRENIETTKDIVKALTRNVGSFNTDDLSSDMEDDDTIEELLKNIVESDKEEETYTMFSIQQHLSIIKDGFNNMLLKDISQEILLQIY